MAAPAQAAYVKVIEQASIGATKGSTYFLKESDILLAQQQAKRGNPYATEAGARGQKAKLDSIVAADQLLVKQGKMEKGQSDAKAKKFYFDSGILCYNSKFYAVAIEYFSAAEKYIGSAPASEAADLFHLQADCLMRLGKYTEAIACFGKEMKLAAPEKQVETLKLRGICFHKAGKFAEALADFEKYLAAKPNDTKIAEFRMHCQIKVLREKAEKSKSEAERQRLAREADALQQKFDEMMVRKALGGQ